MELDIVDQLLIRLVDQSCNVPLAMRVVGNLELQGVDRGGPLVGLLWGRDLNSQPTD